MISFTSSSLTDKSTTNNNNNNNNMNPDFKPANNPSNGGVVLDSQIPSNINNVGYPNNNNNKNNDNNNNNSSNILKNTANEDPNLYASLVNESDQHFGDSNNNNNNNKQSYFTYKDPNMQNRKVSILNNKLNRYSQSNSNEIESYNNNNNVHANTISHSANNGGRRDYELTSEEDVQLESDSSDDNDYYYDTETNLDVSSSSIKPESFDTKPLNILLHPHSLDSLEEVKSSPSESLETFMFCIGVQDAKRYHYVLSKIIPLLTSLQSANLHLVRYEHMYYKVNQISMDNFAIEDKSTQLHKKQIMETYRPQFFECLDNLLLSLLNNLCFLEDKDTDFKNKMTKIMIKELLHYRERLHNFKKAENFKIHHLTDGYGEISTNEEIYGHQMKVVEKLGGGTYSKVYKLVSQAPDYLKESDETVMENKYNDYMAKRKKAKHRKIVNNDVEIEIDEHGNEVVYIDDDDDSDNENDNIDNTNYTNSCGTKKNSSLLYRDTTLGFDHLLKEMGKENIMLEYDAIFNPILHYNNIFNINHYQLGDEFLFYIGSHFYQTYLANNSSSLSGTMNIADFKNFILSSDNALNIALSYFLQYDHTPQCITCLNTNVDMTLLYSDSNFLNNYNLQEHECELVKLLATNIRDPRIFTDSFIFKSEEVFLSCLYFWSSDMNIWKSLFGFYDGTFPHLNPLPDLNKDSSNMAGTMALYDTGKESRNNGIVKAYLNLMHNFHYMDVFPHFTKSDYPKDINNFPLYKIGFTLNYSRFFQFDTSDLPYESKIITMLKKPQDIYQPNFPYADLPVDKEQVFAMKIIRYIDKYRVSARQELALLYLLKENDPLEEKNVLIVTSALDMFSHIMILTPYYPCSVFDFMSMNGLSYFPLSQARSLGKQLFEAVEFLHGLEFIHTDLKPENIVFESKELMYQYQLTEQYTDKLSTRRLRASNGGKRKIMKLPSIKLIDFGTSIGVDAYHPDIICTRHYRAPEIILGYAYDKKSDVWSLGAVLYEFAIGEVLFHIHDNESHLIMMQMLMNQTLTYNPRKSKFRNLKVYTKNYATRTNGAPGVSKESKAIKYLFNPEKGFKFDWDLFINPSIEHASVLTAQQRHAELLFDERRSNYDFSAKDLIEGTKRLDFTITKRLQTQEMYKWRWMELNNFEKILPDNWAAILEENEIDIMSNDLLVLDYSTDDYCQVGSHLCLPLDVNLNSLCTNSKEEAFLNFDSNVSFYNAQFYFLKRILHEKFPDYDSVEGFDMEFVKNIKNIKRRGGSYEDCLFSMKYMKNQLFKALIFKNSTVLDFKLFKAWYLYVDLLRCCFVTDEKERLSVGELLEHPFFRDISSTKDDKIGSGNISNTGLFGYDIEDSNDDISDDDDGDDDEDEEEEGGSDGGYGEIKKSNKFEVDDNIMIWDLGTLMSYFDKLVLYWFEQDI